MHERITAARRLRASSRGATKMQDLSYAPQDQDHREVGSSKSHNIPHNWELTAEAFVDHDGVFDLDVM